MIRLRFNPLIYIVIWLRGLATILICCFARPTLRIAMADFRWAENNFAANAAPPVARLPASAYGSGLARRIFTSQGLVGAAMCSAC